MTIESRYAAEFRSHQRLAEAARKRLPDGVTSDSRCLAPFPLFIASAKGARKWDHDGREFIDLWSGHGALLFGHGAPELLEALREQGSCGTHFGACHPLATEWAEQIAAQMPAAKRVRFTNSGTEAVLLALHLARAFTGRPKILRFAGHYHGWYADARSSEQAADPHDPVLQRAQEVVLTCPNHLDAAAAALREHRDIGAIILEPTGPCSGVVPLDATFVQGLYALSRAHNCVLIFDEIVTGFRVAAGGAQAHYGVQPDLTTLAKIVCGGLPGGAVCGRAEILDQLSKMHLQPNRSAVEIMHLGTYSGNPLSASAGIATLRKIASDPPYTNLESTATNLRRALNQVFERNQLDWLAYGQGSCIKFLIGHGLDQPATALDPQSIGEQTLLARGNPRVRRLLRLAMLLHGVDLSLSSFISTAHTDADIDAIVSAFEAAIEELTRGGDLN